MKPSVSKLIELLDKPALVKWANKLGLEGVHVDDYKSDSKKNGTDNHLAIETYLKFGIESDSQELNEKMVPFFKDKKIISSETVIENEYFIGRYDAKFEYKDFIFVSDFKSNTKNRVYFETKLQLAAYAMVERCHICVVHIPDFVFHPVTIDQPLYEEFLITLSKLYEIRERLNNSK